MILLKLKTNKEQKMFFFYLDYVQTEKKFPSIFEDQNLLYNLLLLYKNKNWYVIFFYIFLNVFI